MINSVKVLFILFLVPGSILAQGGFSVGFKAGANYTRATSGNFVEDELIEHFPNAGFTAGLSMGYNATYYNVGVTLEVLYKNYNQTFQYIPRFHLKSIMEKYLQF